MNNYIVLLFHSIDDRGLSSFKNLGNIHPEIFEKLLVRLKKDFDLISLEEIVKYISGRVESKGRLLAITFDDGPRSYATIGVPIMEPFNIPSTCFLITDFLGNNAIYWRYLYNYCINRGYAVELAGLINAEYKVSISKNEIISFTRNNYNKEKNGNIVRNILNRIVSEEEYMETEKDLFLSLDDIEILKKNNLVSFGIHTRTHPVMMKLSDEEISEEISGSFEFYKGKINQGIPMFSIPFGRLFKDYDERTVIIARSLSIEYIFSAYGGANKKGQPSCNIRRVPVYKGVLENGLDSFVDSLLNLTVAREYILKERALYDAVSRLKR